MSQPVKSGQVVTVVAPSGGATSGVLLIVGGICGVAQTTVLVDEEVELNTRVECDQGKATGFAPAQGDVAYWDVADAELNSDTANPPVGHYTIAAGSNDTVARIRLIDTPIALAASLDSRLDDLEAGAPFAYTFDGAGDQIALTDTNEHVFTKKATVPANAAAIDDWCDWEAEVWVDASVATPQETVKMYLGTAELESQVIATAGANDYVIVRGHGRISGATTMRMYKGLGETKDATLSAHTHAVPADVTIQALSSDRDVTVGVTSNAGNAGNTCTLKALRFTIYKGAIPA